MRVRGSLTSGSYIGTCVPELRAARLAVSIEQEEICLLWGTVYRCRWTLSTEKYAPWEDRKRRCIAGLYRASLAPTVKPARVFAEDTNR